jgi:hypothetical protein
MNSELTREWRKWHNIIVYETGRPPNTARPHQGIAQRAPDGKPDVPRRIGTDLDTLQIRRRPVLNDLINEYTHAA